LILGEGGAIILKTAWKKKKNKKGAEGVRRGGAERYKKPGEINIHGRGREKIPQG